MAYADEIYIEYQDIRGNCYQQIIIILRIKTVCYNV